MSRYLFLGHSGGCVSTKRSRVPESIIVRRGCIRDFTSWLNVSIPSVRYGSSGGGEEG